MAFSVEELKKKAASIGQTGLNLVQNGADKGMQLAAIAKLKAGNVKEDSNLRAAFAELGRMYFADHGTDPEEAYAAVCSQIADIQAAIASNNARIAEMKTAPVAEAPAEAEAEEVEEAAPAEGDIPVVEEAAAETSNPILDAVDDFVNNAE